MRILLGEGAVTEVERGGEGRGGVGGEGGMGRVGGVGGRVGGVGALPFLLERKCSSSSRSFRGWLALLLDNYASQRLVDGFCTRGFESSSLLPAKGWMTGG